MAVYLSGRSLSTAIIIDFEPIFACYVNPFLTNMSILYTPHPHLYFLSDCFTQKQNNQNSETLVRKSIGLIKWQFICFQTQVEKYIEIVYIFENHAIVNILLR